MFLLLSILSSTSIASETGFCHPADIAAKSTAYQHAADETSAAFEGANREAETMASALNSYSEGLDLLGIAQDATEREGLQQLTQNYNRERAVLNKFTNLLLDDFDVTFYEAMERAIFALPQDVVECEATVSSGPVLPGIPVRTVPNPECKGPDLNQTIASAMDADKTLNAAISEISQLPWPAISRPDSVATSTPEATHYLQVSGVMRALAASALIAIDQQDEMARLPILAALEQGASTEQRKTMVAQAREIDQQTASAKAGIAAPILEAINRYTTKKAKKLGYTVGWCANPEALGGCHGEDVTALLLPDLAKDKRVRKALGQ